MQRLQPVSYSFSLSSQTMKNLAQPLSYIKPLQPHRHPQGYWELLGMSLAEVNFRRLPLQ